MEQGHAISAAQDLHHRGAKIFDGLAPLTAIDEGMHHAALNGAGPDNGNLADQIVKFSRPHAGQKVKLRPAFHLKDPNRIGTAQHVIDLRILGWDIGERQTKAAMLRQKVKRLADAGQHPQREDIHLEKPQRVDVVLVPFDDGAILHRGVLDGAKLIQPPLGDDKAADMLRQMAGKADDVADQLQGQHHAAVGRIKPRVTDPVCRGGRRGPAPDLPCQTRDHVLAEAHRLAHLADGGAAAEMDDHRRQPRAVAAIAVINPLDHLFAAFMFEIDVNIRRLAAFFTDEAFEDQGNAFGWHLGDAQEVTNYGIRRRAAPLAQDSL